MNSEQLLDEWATNALSTWLSSCRSMTRHQARHRTLLNRLRVHSLNWFYWVMINRHSQARCWWIASIVIMIAGQKVSRCNIESQDDSDQRLKLESDQLASWSACYKKVHKIVDNRVIDWTTWWLVGKSMTGLWRLIYFLFSRITSWCIQWTARWTRVIFSPLIRSEGPSNPS